MSETRKELNKVLCERIPSIKRFHSLLGRLLAGKSYINAILVLGPAGMGKSYHVQDQLRENGAEYAIYNNHSTALALYRLLFEHNGENCVVVLDDIDAIMQDPHSISLLKAATFGTTGEREVTWNSTTSRLKKLELPQRFVFQGKVIIIANDTRRNVDETFRAFLNRTSQCKLELTPKEKKEVVRLTFKMESELPGGTKDEILKFMEGKVTFGNIDMYNLRTVFHAADLWDYYDRQGKLDDAKELIMDLLEVDIALAQFAVVEERGAALSVERRIEAFEKLTGYKRGVYFKLKRRYRECTLRELAKKEIALAERLVDEFLKEDVK